MRSLLYSFMTLLVLAALGSYPAASSEIERVPPVNHAATARECGECHMAFQPALLPAGSWNRVMDELKDHFGEDASLPDKVAADIRAYLATHAGRGGNPAVIRITEQPWFASEHHYPTSVWQRPDIRTKSNCPACHVRAEVGIFDDD
jgi:hypothetical protein